MGGLHLTRCLRVLRDAAALQLNKHLSTNSDTYSRARASTADNCGVGDVAAACSACFSRGPYGDFLLDI